LESKRVPSGDNLTTGRRSWIILSMEYQFLMVKLVLRMICGGEGQTYFYRHKDNIFGYQLLHDMIVQKGKRLQPRRN
jgi:hypothetical protein